VAALAGFLEARGCYIDEMAVFDDKLEQKFFGRCVFHPAGDDPLADRRTEGFCRIDEAVAWIR
jgi:formyltetrahydrofolate deformylase